MHRSRKYKRKAWRRTKPTAPGFRLPWSSSLRATNDSSGRLTRKESIAFAVIGIALFGGAVLLLNVLTDWSAQRKRQEYLERLRINYSLSEAELAAIRKIENEYHGVSGILFRPSHTYEEETAHRITISQQMPPDSAMRFLADQKSQVPSFGRPRH
ncbi:MAG: hypothetical protein SFU53_10775 [Terrimicrobiaceae bacterium]|nr:hypothetical protein [Terrimicrobiaceae bacterium]